METLSNELIRTFETGATRNADNTKIDPEGFLSPTVIQAFSDYMNKHRVQADGTLRASDNWAKGIPQDAYMKSMWRHFLDVWSIHRGIARFDETGKEIDKVEALCATLFNVQGMLHEQLKKIDGKKAIFADMYYSMGGTTNCSRSVDNCIDK